ncbi:MAG: DUF1800 domain-containing protein [Wenzhouxiangella sp.]|nr:DUF1800 domain-containing protein [Wenzhouxiangella sp.]
MSARQDDLASPSLRRAFLKAVTTREPRHHRQALSVQAAKAERNLSDAAIIPPFEVRVLTRMGFGPRRTRIVLEAAPDPDRIFIDDFAKSDALGSDDIAYFLSLGKTDDERLASYVDEQLSEDLPDPELDQRLSTFPESFSTLDESLAQTFGERECQGFREYIVPQRQIESAAFTRALYSRRQLFELTVDFWHNHFNIFSGGDEDIYVSWADWDRSVIRHHAFGNFHDMVQASAKHPAMLRYLDNYDNEAGGFNENYARELFELHTLGAINYGGTQRPQDVPTLDVNPYAALGDDLLNDLGYHEAIIQAQYVDEDVYEAARALTGWRYDDENLRDSNNNCINGGSGAFFVNEAEHDGGRKGVLAGTNALISSDGGAQQDGETVIKLAAYHPGTARNIALKLCQRLIADDPPETIVQAATETFYANRKHPRQIELTLRTILLSEEFKDPAHWGQKIKRPFEYVVSAMRAAQCDHTWRTEDRDTRDMLWRFEATGQRLFWWRTPDGYPDSRRAWLGSSTIVQNWRTVGWLIDENNNNDSTRIMRILDTTLSSFSSDPTPRELVAFWCHWILGFTPESGWVGRAGTDWANEPTDLGKACMRFMLQAFSETEQDAPSYDADEGIPRDDLRDDRWPYRWHRRLRDLVKLILWSPNFMQR